MIKTRTGEQVENIVLKPAQWCIFTGVKGGEYIITNANGRLIVTKWHSTKRLKPTKEMQSVLYHAITTAPRDVAEIKTESEHTCANSDSDTTDNALDSLFPVIEEYEHFFRSDKFDAILWRSEKGWETRFYLLYYNESVFEHPDIRQQAQEILNQDCNALFLPRLGSVRFDVAASLTEIVERLYVWYMNRIDLLSGYLKRTDERRDSARESVPANVETIEKEIEIEIKIDEQKVNKGSCVTRDENAKNRVPRWNIEDALQTHSQNGYLKAIEIAKILKVKYKTLTKLLLKSIDDLADLSSGKIPKKSKGETVECFLTDSQALFLVLCLPNAPQMVAIKKEIARQIAQRAPPENPETANKRDGKKGKKKCILFVKTVAVS